MLEPGRAIRDSRVHDAAVGRRAHGYHSYFHHVLPFIGGLISGHGTAYKYLPKSVANFPIEEELAARMRAAGFVDVHWRTLTFGVAAIHVGTKRNVVLSAARTLPVKRSTGQVFAR